MCIRDRNGANVSIKSAVDCTGRETKPLSALTAETAHVATQCTISTQGCTDPRLPNQRIAVIYTDPGGTPQVHYVNTDGNGCYSDTITVPTGGVWETQAVLEETDCRAEGRSPAQPASSQGTPGSYPRNWRSFVAFGPNFPVGDLSQLFDPGFSLSFGAERTLPHDVSLVAVFGVHQFYSTAQNRHVLQAGLNLKYAVFHWPDKFAYLQGGASWYRPQGGSNGGGANVGAGLQWTLAPKFALDLHGDYHRFQSSIGRLESGSFVAVQLGLVWSY